MTLMIRREFKPGGPAFAARAGGRLRSERAPGQRPAPRGRARPATRGSARLRRRRTAGTSGRGAAGERARRGGGGAAGTGTPGAAGGRPAPPGAARAAGGGSAGSAAARPAAAAPAAARAASGGATAGRRWQRRRRDGAARAAAARGSGGDGIDGLGRLRRLDVRVPSAGCAKMTARPSGGKVTVANDHIYDFPASYDGTKPFPLLMGFHAAGNPIDQIEGLTNNTDFATNYVRAFPKSAGNEWVYNTDLTPKVYKVYDDLMANYCIDTSRVFATGHSSAPR